MINERIESRTRVLLSHDIHVSDLSADCSCDGSDLVGGVN